MIDPPPPSQPADDWVYLVIATGPLFRSAVERTAVSATEALAHHLALTRQCGRAGRVEIVAKGGRSISVNRLKSLARAEEARALDAPQHCAD